MEHASDRMRELLGLQKAAPMDGVLELGLDHPVDHCKTMPHPLRVHHRSLLSGGSFSHTAMKGVEKDLHVFATVHAAGENRPAAICRRTPRWNGGALCWVRGSNASPLQSSEDSAACVSGDLLLRQALDMLNVTIGFDKRTLNQRNPALTISRNANALYFAGYMPDTTVALRLTLPGGAPLLTGCDAEISDTGHMIYHMPRAWRRECRVLVEQSGGTVTCREQISGMVGVARRLRVEGLCDATVRFLPEPDTESRVTFQSNPQWPYVAEPWLQPTIEHGFIGLCLKVEHVTGSLLISW